MASASDRPRPDPDEGSGAEHYVPQSRSLRTLSTAAKSCHGCELYRNATQTVFGSGPRDARVLLLGEQPGDQEDRQGEPFVGPAGKLLDRALAEAGLSEQDVYRTNAVKHFRWRPPPGGGKRRIHQSPTQAQITACRPWLVAELEAVHPDVVVALGASAGKSLFGPSFRVGESRGTVRTWSPEAGAGAESGSGSGVDVVVTVHPSSVLRADDRQAAFDGLVADLRTVAEVLK
jgi:uracil-DNA glycosylase family protein